MLQRELFTEAEVEVTKAHAGNQSFLLLTWALTEVEAALQESVARGVVSDVRVTELLAFFRVTAFKFRGHCGQITNWMKNPVPFPYYHGLNLLVMCNLGLISWTLISMDFDTPLTAITYVLIATSFFGLKQVAVQMTDPFGDDAIDFDIEGMLAASFRNSVILLKDTHETLGRTTTIVNPLEEADDIDCFTSMGEKCALRTELMAANGSFNGPTAGRSASTKATSRLSVAGLIKILKPVELVDDKMISHHNHQVKPQLSQQIPAEQAQNQSPVRVPDVRPTQPTVIVARTVESGAAAGSSALHRGGLAKEEGTTAGRVAIRRMSEIAINGANNGINGVNNGINGINYNGINGTRLAANGINGGRIGVNGISGVSNGTNGTRLGVIGGGIPPVIRPGDASGLVSMNKGRRGKK